MPRIPSSILRLAALAGALAVGIVVGRTALDTAPAPADAVDPALADRVAAPDARLTTPWYGAAGMRALAGPLVLLESSLEGRVAELRRSDPTLRVGIYLRELGSGLWIGVDESEPFVPASLMKVAVLFHALSRVEDDPTLMDRMVRYPGPEGMPSADNTAGRPPAERLTPGESYTFAELLHRMVAYSDNHAKDLVLDGIDPAQVDAWMTSIGFPVQVDDGRAITTPKSYGALFRILYNSSRFSRENSEFALGLLLDATFDRGIRGVLPPEVPVASKFGMHFDPTDLAAGVQLHECGIVYEGDPWILCIMTRSSLKSLEQLAGIVRDVTAEAVSGRAQAWK